MSRALLSALAVLAAAGCADRITTEDPPTTSFNADVWSGGLLVVRSPLFRAGDPLPTVTVGADTLGVTVFPSDSVLVQVPDTNGLVTMVIQAAGGRMSGSVRIHGFVAATPGPVVDGPIYAWPGGGNPTALAIHDGRLLSVDFRTGLTTPVLPDTGLNRYGCLYGGAMPSVDRRLVTVARGNCGPAIAMPLVPGSAPADTGPSVFTYPAVHLGTGRWLVATHHYYLFEVKSGSGWIQSGPFYAPAPEGFVVSPRGDRVVPLSGGSGSAGAPVFDTIGPGPVYWLPLLGGSAFNEAGDTLFAVEGSSLVAADPATGATLARAPLHLFWNGSGVALDPRIPVVYVAGYGNNNQPIIEVFARSTLQRITVLRVPPGTVPSYLSYFSDYILIASAAAPHLYLVLNPWGVATPVLTFDVPWP